MAIKTVSKVSPKEVKGLEIAIKEVLAKSALLTGGSMRAIKVGGE